MVCLQYVRGGWRVEINSRLSRKSVTQKLRQHMSELDTTPNPENVRGAVS